MKISVHHPLGPTVRCYDENGDMLSRVVELDTNTKTGRQSCDSTNTVREISVPRFEFVASSFKMERLLLGLLPPALHKHIVYAFDKNKL